MRIIILFFFGLYVTNYCYGQTKNDTDSTLFNLDKTFEINGSVKNYIPDSKNRFITFRTYTISGKMKDTAIQIDANGFFKATLFQPFEWNLTLMFDNGYAILYISPGDKINIEIDYKKWKTEEKGKAFTTSGKFSNTIKLIADFDPSFTKHVFKINPDWRNKLLSDTKVSSTRIKRMKEELIFLSAYIIENKITDSVFKEWETNSIIHKAGADIAFNCFTYNRNRSLTYQQLIDVLKNIPLNNINALHNSDYYNFLSLLSTDFEIIVNINPAYKSERKINGENPVPVALEKIDLYATGIAKQLLYYNNYFTNSLTQTGFYMNRYQKNITDNYLKEEFEKNKLLFVKPFEAYNIIQKIKNYKIEDSLKNNLLNIFEKEKGNYLFVDFWASWCSPCMQEMTIYPKLIDHFKDSSIHFLFFAVETPQEKVSEIKKEYNINGNFILLTANEIKILNNILVINSYPHHFIINPDGLVINNSITSIVSGDSELSQKTVKELRDILSKGKE